MCEEGGGRGRGRERKRERERDCVCVCIFGLCVCVCVCIGVYAWLASIHDGTMCICVCLYVSLCASSVHLTGVVSLSLSLWERYTHTRSLRFLSLSWASITGGLITVASSLDKEPEGLRFRVWFSTKVISFLNKEPAGSPWWNFWNTLRKGFKVISPGKQMCKVIVKTIFAHDFGVSNCKDFTTFFEILCLSIS